MALASPATHYMETTKPAYPIAGNGAPAVGTDPASAEKSSTKKRKAPSPAPANAAAASVDAMPKGKMKEQPAKPEDAEKEEKSDTSMIVVAKAVRMLLKNHPMSMHCGSDAIPALNVKVTEIIMMACERARVNGRKTLKSIDF